MSTSDEAKPGVFAPDGYPQASLPPELPEVGERQPRWPPWYGPAALVAGLAAYSLVLIVIDGVLKSAGASTKSPTATDLLTVGQDVVFVATAVAFASMTARPRAWHFGLRGRPLRPTAGWAALGMASYLALLAVYSVTVTPHGKQDVTKDLGANSSTAALIGGALVVLIVVPIAEELFFRGFFYTALRTRFNIWVAAAIDAVVFGAVHYTGSGTLELLPELAVLGFVFCLVYERTGTIYATIALHAFNNAIAYGVGTHHGEVVSAVLGTVMIAGTAVAVVVTPRGPVQVRGSG